jgi:hypothetical protein
MTFIPTKKTVQARINGAKSRGRPKGSLGKTTLALRDRVRASQEEIVSRLFFLLHEGENHAVQLAAARELLDRGWGKPVQMAAVGIGGEDGSAVQILVTTGVPRLEPAAPCFPGTPRTDSLTY